MPGTGRNQIAYDDERMTSQTFWADNATIVFTATAINGLLPAALGKAVTYSATNDDTVKLAADGDAIVGKLLKCEPDGACTVQIAGYTSLPLGTAAVATRGRRLLGALNGGQPGFVRDANSATAAELVRTGPYCVAINDPAGIWVDFGG